MARRAGCALDLGCDVCAGARSVPRSAPPERTGEARGVELEPKEREAGFGRAPLALGRLRAAGLESAALLRAVVLLTDLRGASVGGRVRALGAGRESPNSVALVRRVVAGEGAPEVGPEESGDKPKGPEGLGYHRGVPPRALEPNPPQATYLSVLLSSPHFFWAPLRLFLWQQVPHLEAVVPSGQQSLIWGQWYVTILPSVINGVHILSVDQ